MLLMEFKTEILLSIFTHDLQIWWVAGPKTKSNGTHYIASRHCIAPFLTKKAFFLLISFSMPGFSLLHY